MVNTMNERDRLLRYHKTHHKAGLELCKKYSFAQLNLKFRSKTKEGIAQGMQGQTLILENMVVMLYLSGQFPIVKLSGGDPKSAGSGSFRMEDGMLVGTFHHHELDYLYYMETEFDITGVAETLSSLGHSMRARHQEYMQGCLFAMLKITEEED